MPSAVQILSLLLSAAAALIGTLVLYNLNAINHRVEKLETDSQKYSDRKAECQREFVDLEQWLRSEGYTRARLDELVKSYASLAGSFNIFERLPQICGNIVRETLKETRGGN